MTALDWDATFEKAKTSAYGQANSILGEALDAVVRQVQTYIECTHEEAVAISLWVAYTHCIDPVTEPPFDVVPYLFVSSAEKQSGKTTLLNVLEPLVARPKTISGTSAAAFVRGMGQRPTLFFDEVDAVFIAGRSSETTEMLRAALNSGYHVTGSHDRYDVTRKQTEALPVFGAKALFGIGRTVPDTVLDRSIHISLRRRNGGGTKRARLARLKSEGRAIEKRLSASVMPGTLRQFGDDDFPEELSDRACDIWEPLLALGEQAGGEWPAESRAAAVALTSERDELQSLGQQLLHDIRIVFEDFADNFIPTLDIIGHPADLPSYGATGLCAVEEGPWVSFERTRAPITPHTLWNLLRGYGLKPKHTESARGLWKPDFTDPFRRYLDPLPDAVEDAGPDAPDTSDAS